MPVISTSSVTAVDADAVRDYRERGWTVAETANGVCLITDERIAAVEVSGALAAGVRRFLQANKLSGPVIELAGAQPREIHLVVGAAKAAAAIEALRSAGALVHTDGASIPLPPTRLAHGSACWRTAPSEARWVPPLVAIAAAVRATETVRARHVSAVAC